MTTKVVIMDIFIENKNTTERHYFDKSIAHLSKNKFIKVHSEL